MVSGFGFGGIFRGSARILLHRDSPVKGLGFRV